MDENKIYLITDQDGFSPEISRLVSMMNYVRKTTIDAVKGLTTEQLDYQHDEHSNSIGALLSHIASIEFGYQLMTFEHREPTEAEKKQWLPSYELGELGREAIKGNNLEHYIDLLVQTRLKTLDELRKRPDSWLYEETLFWGNKPANNYFKWFHVFEDELSHRGQIRWIIKRIPDKLQRTR